MEHIALQRKLKLQSMLTIFAFLSILSFVTVSPMPAAAANAPDSFADLAEKLSPTVVNIYTTQVVKAPQYPNNFFHNPEDMPEFFKHFFDLPEGQQQQQMPQREEKRTSLGSGVIITKDGYIITNNHVVENADSINVRLTDYEEYDAKIIGRDPKTDIALIKIDPKEDLPFVEFGDSNKLRVGDWVMAIGNPFGFSQTVTAGIVSGKGRSLGSGPYENFIQTDASINPGNSGGPLFDMDGKMVGINTAIYSRSGGNIGIGFAIPVNMAKFVIEQLKTSGKVTRGWLGVMIQHVTPELADQFKLDRPIGALVGEVTPDSPAAKAGIKQGDIIIAYNGREVTQMSLLPAMVAQTPVGSKADVTLYRDGKKKNITVTIAKLEEDETVFSGTPAEPQKNLGMTVQEITPEIAKSMGLEDTSGVLVANVEPDSPAYEAGVRRGDVIIEVSQKPITNLESYKKARKETDGSDSILLLIKRENRTRYVAVKKK